MNPTITSFTLLALGLALVATSATADDSKLVDLFEKVSLSANSVEAITRKFEIAATAPTSDQIEQLKSILESSKSLTKDISTSTYDLKKYLTEMGPFEKNSFQNKIMAEFQLLTVNRLFRQLKALQLEILGFTNGVSRIPNYHFSEHIFLVANTFVEKHMITAFQKLAKVDKLIEEAMKKNESNPSLDSATRQKVIKLLKEFQVEIKVSKKVIVDELYSEIEKMRLNGEELGLQNHFDMEYAVDVFNFSIDFAAKNVQLFEKLGDHNMQKVLEIFF